MAARLRRLTPGVCAVCLAAGLLRGGEPPGVPRRELSLNGPWECGVTRDPDAEQPPAWEPVTVPHLRRGPALGGSDYLWYRRRVDLPAEWAGGRIVLVLVGARYHPRVCVDGHLAGERLEGWTPFEVDITQWVTPGAPFTLAVRCQDWAATFADGFTLPEKVAGDLRDAPRASVIAPIGGHFAYYGMWDDVVLERRPATALADVAVIPSVRDWTLRVRGGCERPAAGLRVAAVVAEGETPVLELPAAPLGADGRWELSAPFPRARCWSPEDPHLYWLRLSLADDQGRQVDRLQVRFGFRELWTEGPQFVLNGVRRHLLASSGWPVPESQTPEEIRENILRLRQANCVAFRLHTQPWQRRWLDAADELGLMIVEEGALWCDGAGSYRYQDRRFWDNVWTHLSGMVRRDRNHASLVMWSLENEILHCGAARYHPECEAELADLGLRVKALDPGHLITFEADLDPKGVADVIGLHYPHEMPEHKDYPNTADWLEKTVTTGTEGGLLGSRRAAFTWDRTKPLYIGEYLWVPFEDYSPGSVFFGDEAYRDRARYKRLSIGAAWEHQTIAYRRAGVSGMCPWTFAGSGGRTSPTDVLYAVQRHIYAPLAIYRQTLQTRFFRGDRPTLRWDVFNDTPAPRRLEVVLELDGVASALTEPFTLGPAEHRQIALQPPLASASGPGGLRAAARLLAEGQEVHRAEAVLFVSERAPLRVPAGVTLLLYDPSGEWAAGPGKALGCTRPGQLEELRQSNPAATLLLAAPGAWGKEVPAARDFPLIGIENTAAAAVRAYLLAGGRALVLEQDRPDPWELGVELTGPPSTMVFSTAPEHPFLAGLTAEDLRFWAGDHYVTRREVRRPAAQGGQALLVSGGASSLAFAALVDLPYGPGRVVLCQALAGTRLDTEPAARRLFQNLLDGLAQSPPPRRGTVLVAEGPGADAFLQAAREVRLDAAQPDGPLTRDAGAAAALVVLHGAGEHILASADGLAACLQAGGTVYWHAPEPAAFEALRERLGLPGWEVRPCCGPLTVRAPWTAELSGVCLEDLTYAGSARGESWMRGFDLDPAVADRCFLPGAPAGEERRYEAETMVLAGRYVRVSQAGQTVHFASAGTASGKVRTPGPGLYLITLHAGGTPAQGAWPQVALSWDEQPAALISLTGNEIRPYTTAAELPGGEGTLTIAYVNDAVIDGEDRNLEVDAVSISAAPIEVGPRLRLLTQPTALTAALATPAGGRVVLDGVRWDTAGENLLRGRRYGSALLRNLGASFLPPERPPDWVRPDQFRPVGQIPHFRQDADQITLAAAGTVEARFECAAAGRYEIFLRGWSVPAAEEYARALVALDGQDLCEIEVRARTGAVFTAAAADIAAGMHTVSVRFTNDLYRPPEDRNLYLQGVGFRRTPAP